ncbi:uncharacterized protein FOMMEDRAFT_100062, partial [Fomitiporia mediterranea MF3/22]
EIHQIDIKSAYLYGQLMEDKEIYVKPPPGNLIDRLQNGQILQLQKVLYRLKQAGRRWYKMLSNILLKYRLTKSEHDNTVFFAKKKEITVAILFVHVDNITIVAMNNNTITMIKQSIVRHLQYTDSNELHWLLSIEIQCNREHRFIRMCQTHYINSIIECYKLTNERSVQTPIQPGTQLKTVLQTDNDRKQMSDIPYMNMVGTLRYIADCTQSDIAFATNQLAKYLNDPGMEHYLALKHCYMYLKTTNNVWLQLSSTNQSILNSYTDTDSMMQEGHCAISGYAFYLSDSLVSWSSKRQTLVANSMYEAELIALARGTQEVIILMHLAEEILQVSDAPINIFYNNNTVI